MGEAGLENQPLLPPEFAALMAGLGPLPDPPRLAVAVSGGPDSLALTHLLADWCGQRGGSLLALTVDHDLRPGSRREARALARHLAAAGIACRVLTWQGGSALRGRGKAIQVAARQARYALLLHACRQAGLLHLALGHQADDQDETFLLRLVGGSGPLGLAAMPAVVARGDLLLLRPLLGVGRGRLRATLRARGLSWVEDPSNRDPRHRRVALRQALPGLMAQGLPSPRLPAEGFGRLRRALEPWAADLFVRCVTWHPAGFAWLDAGVLADAASPLAGLVLGELLRSVGGGDHAPGGTALAALLAHLVAGGRRGRTLGGCRLTATRQGWLVVREAAGLPDLTLVPGQATWDGRFAVSVPRRLPADLRLRALGRQGWTVLAAALAPSPLPGPALWSLPALYDALGPREVPALGWRRPGCGPSGILLRFCPQPPAGSFSFTVACERRHII